MPTAEPTASNETQNSTEEEKPEINGDAVTASGSTGGGSGSGNSTNGTLLSLDDSFGYSSRGVGVTLLGVADFAEALAAALSVRVSYCPALLG